MESLSHMRHHADTNGVLNAPVRAPARVSRLRGEHGFSLVEVMVAMAVALVLLVPTVLLITTAQNHANGDITRSDTIAFASTGLREMDQELRQTYQIEFPTGSTGGSGSTATTAGGVGAGNVSCTESAAGVEPCNVIDVLTRLTNTGLTTATVGDYEVRYDCSIPSTTISGDFACWRYVCSATASTAGGSSCTSSTSSLLSKKLVVDDLVNGSASDFVFSLCYPSVTTASSCSSSSAARPTSASVTLKLPSTGTQAQNRGGDPAVIYLTDGLYFPNLDFSQ